MEPTQSGIEKLIVVEKLTKENQMKLTRSSLIAAVVLTAGATAFGQAPPAGAPGGGRGPGGPPRPALSVTTSAFPDGGEVP